MELQLIQSKIHDIRGEKVMLDFDLAELYLVETRALKQAVRRNIDRFPDDFMFELTPDEYKSLRSQIVTLETGRGKHSKYSPFAFTEQGVAMLSSVLTSKLAININISIMRAFVAIRRVISDPIPNDVSKLQQEVRELKTYIEESFTDYNDINEDTRMQFELINQTLAELQTQRRSSEKRNPIGFVKSSYKE